jgi:hypothetical protein
MRWWSWAKRAATERMAVENGSTDRERKSEAKRGSKDERDREWQREREREREREKVSEWGNQIGEDEWVRKSVGESLCRGSEKLNGSGKCHSIQTKQHATNNFVATHTHTRIPNQSTKQPIVNVSANKWKHMCQTTSGYMTSSIRSSIRVLLKALGFQPLPLV